MRHPAQVATVGWVMLGLVFKWFPLCEFSLFDTPVDGGAWWAAVHGVSRSRTWLSNFTFTFHFHALEKEMATHSSVLAWRIPGMGEPGGLPSMGLHSRTWLKRLSSSSSRICFKRKMLKNYLLKNTFSNFSRISISLTIWFINSSYL